MKKTIYMNDPLYRLNEQTDGGGWGAEDSKELKEEYGFTDEELEIVLDKLAEIENR